MEMPENLDKTESKRLLGTVLQDTFDCGEEIPFEDLLEKIGYVKPCRECVLDETEQRLIRLLHTSANTQRQ
jgi:hypothetical protein